MNQRHVVTTASNAVARAMNALNDLQISIMRLDEQDRLGTSVKVRRVQQLMQEIDAALTDPRLVEDPAVNSTERTPAGYGASARSHVSQIATEQPSE
ncbi:MAG TPA: hypothetical protein VIL32_11130 [Steroidobacteraceae bacterium]